MIAAALDLLSVVSVVVSLFGFAVAAQYANGKPLGFNMFVAVCGVTGLVYASGLAGLLVPGAIVLKWVGLMLFVGVPTLGRHRKWLPELRSPPIVMLLTVLALFWVFYRNISPVLWDEFSHWALATREILRTGRFLEPGNPVAHYLDYPPGLNCFHLFFVLNSCARESVFYLAQVFLIVCSMAALLDGVSWRRWPGFGLRLAVLITFGLVLGYDLYLGPDHVMGWVFAAALFSYFSHCREPREALWLVPALFVLPLLKSVGIVHGMAAGLVILVDVLVGGRGANGPVSEAGVDGVCRGWPAGRRPVTGVMWRVAVALLIIAVPVCSRASWQVRNRMCGIGRTCNLPRVDAKDFLDVGVRREGSSVRVEARDNFVRALYMWPLGRSHNEKRVIAWLAGRVPVLRRLEAGVPRLTALGWSALIALVYLLSVAAARPGRWRRGALLAFGAFLVLWPVYLVLHLCIYLFLLGGAEAVGLASYGRYASIFFLGHLLLSSALLARCVDEAACGCEGGRYRVFSLWLLLCCISYVVVFDTPKAVRLIRPVGYPAERIRSETREQTDFILSRTGAGDLMQLVCEDEGEFDWLLAARVLRYVLAPRLTMGAMHELDPVPVALKAGAWLDQLVAGGYRYVYVLRAGEEFWGTYGAAFSGDRVDGDFLFTIKGVGQAGEPRLVPVRR